ncbi:hypothetical protein BDZ85DRAFT_16647 [Elsinoe ampelina]|uniref:Uncharacterized protein n=1 Tax=Elsinoe ampelina TaxID=302913 RepID=A0A6A6G6V4_9PEZI|nr:hypothetical protein BDZ85DRAFT_16647 [Elsinoe ampelina]
MTAAFTGESTESFDDLYAHLKTFPTPLLPPGKSHDPKMTDRIASLYVHPTLESLLHILNLDLPSAHFLVRHMQAAPQHEGMYIHGLLHRIEGDYDNSRAWYADVCTTDAFTSFYPNNTPTSTHPLSFLFNLPSPEQDALENDLDAPSRTSITSSEPEPRILHTKAGGKLPSQTSARYFISAIEKLRRSSASSQEYTDRKAALEKASRAEIEALVQFCVDKYGTEKVKDASKVWVQPGEEHRAMGEKMVSGGEGWRKF